VTIEARQNMQEIIINITDSGVSIESPAMDKMIGCTGFPGDSLLTRAEWVWDYLYAKVWLKHI